MNKMLNEEPLNTKWGTIKLNNEGYYQVTSRKEGYPGKLWHRLIYEEFYGEIPERYIIHHKNGNKQDNCILNLQLMGHSEHNRLHMVGENNPNYNRIFSDETRIKMSAARKGNKYALGLKHSDETKKKISESMMKNYPRIVKCGFTNSKQQYCIMWKGSRKRLKQSYYIDKLVKWFETNYPDEELKIEV